jgi:hypothetical protein
MHITFIGTEVQLKKDWLPDENRVMGCQEKGNYKVSHKFFERQINYMESLKIMFGSVIMEESSNHYLMSQKGRIWGKL